MLKSQRLPKFPIKDDPSNPFWYPRISAVHFLESVQRDVMDEEEHLRHLSPDSSAAREIREFESFSRKLCNAFVDANDWRDGGWLFDSDDGLEEEEVEGGSASDSDSSGSESISGSVAGSGSGSAGGVSRISQLVKTKTGPGGASKKNRKDQKNQVAHVSINNGLSPTSSVSSSQSQRQRDTQFDRSRAPSPITVIFPRVLPSNHRLTPDRHADPPSPRTSEKRKSPPGDDDDDETKSLPLPLPLLFPASLFFPSPPKRARSSSESSLWCVVATKASKIKLGSFSPMSDVSDARDDNDDDDDDDKDDGDEDLLAIDLDHIPSLSGSDHVEEEEGNSRDGLREKLLASYKQRLETLEDELYGPYFGPPSPETVQNLIIELDRLMPGIRLKSQLEQHLKFVSQSQAHDMQDQDDSGFSDDIVPDSRVGGGGMSSQAVLDHLANRGHVTTASLELFRSMDGIFRLDLTESVGKKAVMAPVEGVKDVLRVLRSPNSFAQLGTLVLTDVRLEAYDLTYFHHLPAIDALYLSNTGIGNEALHHLVRLKHSLTSLYLASNRAIDDNAGSTLAHLDLLDVLDIRGTSIDMPGLRDLVRHVRSKKRQIHVDLPGRCLEYLNNIDTQYARKIVPPLITDPHACSSLSIASLKRNLATHAKAHLTISVGGTKEEMCSRLEALLKRREDDERVMRVLGWEDDLLVGSIVDSHGGGEEGESRDITEASM